MSVIDLESGERVEISGKNSGSGAELGKYGKFVGLEYDSQEQKIIVADYLTNHVLTVDEITGERLIISDNDASKGPKINQIGRIVFDSINNRLFVVDTGLKAIFVINIDDGSRAIVSR